MSFNLPPGVSLRDLDGGSAECANPACQAVGPVDEDGFCETCAVDPYCSHTCRRCGDQYELRDGEEPTRYCDQCAHEIAEGRRFEECLRQSLKPQADITIYYPSGWGFSYIKVFPRFPWDGTWPLLPETTTWKRWMPIFHPGEETQWSLEVIYP